MSRVTNKQIELVVSMINSELGVPNEPYATERDARGGLVANPGVVYLAGAYGGVRLEQMCAGGGSRDLLRGGYGTKREIFNQAHAYLAGLEARARA